MNEEELEDQYQESLEYLKKNKAVACVVLGLSTRSKQVEVRIKHRLAETVIHPFVRQMAEGEIKRGLTIMLGELERQAERYERRPVSEVTSSILDESFLNRILENKEGDVKYKQKIIELKNRVKLAYAACALILAVGLAAIVAGTLGLAGLPVAAAFLTAGTFIAVKAGTAIGILAAHKAVTIATAAASGSAYLASKAWSFKNKIASYAQRDNNEKQMTDSDSDEDYKDLFSDYSSDNDMELR